MLVFSKETVKADRNMLIYVFYHCSDVNCKMYLFVEIIQGI